MTIISTFATPSFAVGSDFRNNNINNHIDEEMYEQATLFAKEHGINILPFNDVLDAQQNSNDVSDNYETSYDYIGKNDVPISKTWQGLMDNPSADINGGISIDNAQVITVPSSTNDSITVAGETDWFTFRVPGNGAYNIYTIGNSDTYMEVYKKNWNGTYSMIDSNDDGGDAFNSRLELGLSMNTDYYISIRAFPAHMGSYVLVVEENVDFMFNVPNGGSWNWYLATPDPDGVYFSIDKIVYLNATDAMAYYIMVSNDSIRMWRDYILDLTTEAAITFVINNCGVPAPLAAAVVAAITRTLGLPNIPSLTDIELQSIANAANMQSDGHFSNGIKITSVTTYYSVDNGMMMPLMLNTYSSWYGYNMMGEPRYRGTFDLNDKTPLWR